MSRCSSCRAEIIWAATEAGKAIPLDPVMSPAGNLIAIEGRPGLTVRTKAPLLERHLVGYVPHFATCPQADNHRRR